MNPQIPLVLAALVLLSDFAFANTNGDITNNAISKIYADTGSASNYLAEDGVGLSVCLA